MRWKRDKMMWNVKNIKKKILNIERVLKPFYHGPVFYFHLFPKT